MTGRNSKGNQGCASVVTYLFFSIFLVVGLGVLWALAISPFLQLRSAKSRWIEVPCVVHKIEVKIHSGDSNTYSPDVLFEYVVDGKRYTSSQFWFGTGSYGNRKAIADVIAPFQPGGEYPCYVNPTRPSEAVLVRRLAAHAWLGWLFGGIFSAVGAIAMIATYLSNTKAKRKTITWKDPIATVERHDATQRSASKQSLMGEPLEGQPIYTCDLKVCPREDEGPDEPMILAAKESRVGNAVGGWVFALIWNGISWTIAYFIVKDFHWFAAIFMSVFLLIGLAIIVFAFYSTLQIWNPRTTVVCSQRNLYPGSEFEISWLHSTTSSSIAELSIELEGQESATYRQGTTNRTDKSIFHKQMILKTVEPSEISQGFRLVQVPLDTMHTFEAARNSVVWQIRVHGKIRFWPDIRDTYAVTIYAPPIEGA